MDTALAGRVAVVTGGTGALGRHVVRELMDRGAVTHVPWRGGRTASELEEFLGEARAGLLHLHEADLTRDDVVRDLFREVRASSGRLDILANLAGGFAGGSLEETSPETWDRLFALNARTAFLCSRAAVALMAGGGRGGRIVNVAAMPALRRGAAGMGAYAASKAAVLSLTHTLSAELRGRGITVNALVPTTLDTPDNRSSMPDADTSAWLDPADVARVVAFLVGSDAAIVTGAAITLAVG